MVAVETGADALSAPLRARASSAAFRRSYPIQYTPLNGTSRHSVGERPRHREATPCAATSRRSSVTTLMRLPAAIALVRTSSSGDMAEAVTTRPATPATSGVKVAASEPTGAAAVSTPFSSSYAVKYSMLDGTAIASVVVMPLHRLPTPSARTTLLMVASVEGAGGGGRVCSAECAQAARRYAASAFLQMG